MGNKTRVMAERDRTVAAVIGEAKKFRSLPTRVTHFERFKRRLECLLNGVELDQAVRELAHAIDA